MGSLFQLSFRLRNFLLRQQPRLSLRLLSVLAHLRLHAPSQARRELEANLRLAFPDCDRPALARLARRTLVANLIDSAIQFRLELLSVPELRAEAAALRVIEAGHFQEACRDGRLLIVVTPHYGCFMHAALRLAAEPLDRPICFFYNPTERNPYANTNDRLLKRINPACVQIRNDRRGVIVALRALQRGAVLCIMHDQITPEGEFAYVPFFGQFFAAMQGTAFLALKSRARIVPLYCCPIQDSLALQYRPPITVEATPGVSEQVSIYHGTVALFAEIERQLRHAPAHWRYWNQFQHRSAVLQPPHSRADLLAQLAETRRHLATSSLVATVLQDWEKLLRELPASA